MEEFIQYGTHGSILCMGIFVQAAAGFAGGLFIIPALLWFGEGLPEAQAALLVATIPQNAMGLWSLRASVNRKQVVWPGLARISFLPIGMLTLMVLETTVSKSSLRQIVGSAVLCITLAIIFVRPEPREQLRRFWAWIAFPVSGFCQGLVGMGGPAMVFWVQAHDWDTSRIRGFMFSMYMISIPPALIALYACFGNRIIQPSIVAAATTPALIIATALGLRCGSWLGRKRLRFVTLGLLILVGLAGIAAPLL